MFKSSLAAAVALVFLLTGCTREDDRRAKQKLNQAGKELKHEFNEATREIKKETKELKNKSDSK